MDLIFELFLFIFTHLSFSVYFGCIVVDLALVLVEVHVVHLVFELQIFFVSLQGLVDGGALHHVVILYHTVVVFWLQIGAVEQIFHGTNLLSCVGFGCAFAYLTFGIIGAKISRLGGSDHFLIVIHVTFQITFELVAHSLSILFHHFLAHKWEIIVPISLSLSALNFSNGVILANDMSILLLEVFI